MIKSAANIRYSVDEVSVVSGVRGRRSLVAGLRGRRSWVLDEGGVALEVETDG